MSPLQPSPPPTVNRSVHFYSPELTLEGEVLVPSAAIIVQVNRDSVDLAVFGKGAKLGQLIGMADVPFSLAPMAGHWTWPPRS